MEMYDPLYLKININESIVQELIETKMFKRLRKIKQQGNTFFLISSAVHNRYEHSIGVYRIMCDLLESLKSQLNFSEFEVKVAKVSALLHDIGHGPFSHCFEEITLVNHEKWTELFILDNEIRSILEKEPDLLYAVLSVIKKDKKFPLIEELIHAEIGADKLDYITRDLYYSGFNEFTFNSKRIIDNMLIYRNKLIYNYNALNEINNFYVIKRYLYDNSFYHPFTLGKDLLLKQILKKTSTKFLAKSIGFKTNNELSMTNLPFEFFSKLTDEIISDEINRILDSTFDEELEFYCKSYLNPYENLRWIDCSTKQHKSIIKDLELANYKIIDIKSRNTKYGSYNGKVNLLLNDKIFDVSEVSETISYLCPPAIVNIFYHSYDTSSGQIDKNSTK